jgi:hypothetical protein
MVGIMTVKRRLPGQFFFSEPALFSSAIVGILGTWIGYLREVSRLGRGRLKVTNLGFPWGERVGRVVGWVRADGGRGGEGGM